MAGSFAEFLAQVRPGEVPDFAAFFRASAQAQRERKNQKQQVPGSAPYEHYTFSFETKLTEEDGVVTVSGNVQYKNRHKRKSVAAPDPASTIDAVEHVGVLKGHLLDRPHPNFWINADEISSELEGLASLFCDATGRAHKIHHPEMTTSATQGGGFLYLELVEIKPEHRGSDLGLEFTHQLFRFLKDRWTLAVMVPGWITEGYCQWAGNKPPQGFDGIAAMRKLRRHWMRIGFVQAGCCVSRSEAWFLTADKYFAGQGFQRLSKEQVSGLVVHESPKEHVPEGLDHELQQLMHHYGSPRYDGSQGLCPEAIARIQQLVRRGASIHRARAFHLAARYGGSASVFRNLISLGGDVNSPDENGSRPLHTAARNCFEAVPSLLEVGADAAVKDVNGETAMDALMTSIRSAQSSRMDAGIGFIMPGNDVTDLQVAVAALMPAQSRSGLIDGWLSPRMREMMLCTADIAGDYIRDVADSAFTKYVVMPLDEIGDAILHLEYIPPEVLRANPEGLYKSFAKGWSQMFRAIGIVLRNNKLPTVRRVKEALSIDPGMDSRMTEHFFQKGGKVTYAVDALIHLTQQSFLDKGGVWQYDDFMDQIEALPASPFDDMFDVVRLQCFDQGGDVLLRRGPYKESANIAHNGPNDECDSDDGLDSDEDDF